MSEHPTATAASTTGDDRLTDAELVAAAADMLDEETHRYVERFTDCPNGCRYDYRPGTTDLARTAGPDDCDACSYGQVEDEQAAHLDPFVAQLRGLAERIRAAARELADLDVEGWPQHLTCREAETLAGAMAALGAGQLAGELLASHAEGDDDPEDMHHGG